jgi:hypothetical protein
MEKSHLFANKYVRKYFDNACPEQYRRAQYDKNGFFTQVVSDMPVSIYREKEIIQFIFSS